MEQLEIPEAHFSLSWEEILKPRERMGAAKVTWLATSGWMSLAEM